LRFCSTCGTRLRVKVVKTEEASTPAMACEKCGFYEKVASNLYVTETEEKKVRIKVVGDKETKIKTMPTTMAECPKCKHTTAFWWMLQTRSGDEAPTQFFRCEKCDYTWRQYA